VIAPNIESDTDILHEFLAFKAARINADGNARMDGSTWHSLTPEDKAIWDTISESAKSTILKVAASPSQSSDRARQPPRRQPPRQVNNRDVTTIVNDFVAYLHFAQLESEDETEQTSDMSSQNDSTALTEEPNDYKAYLTKVIDKKVKPSDPRRMMSSSLARNPPTKPTTKKVTIDGETFVREANMVTSSYHHRIAEESLHLREVVGSLVDRGTNITVAGNNCRVISEMLHVRADVTGFQNHQATNLKVGTVGYFTESWQGPCISIIPQSALLGTGNTMISAAQLEAHGVVVNDKSSVVGGKQYISTPDGYDFPIDIVNGLPYTPMRPFTDEEWETLPHVFLGAADWDPRSLDCILSDKEKWHDTISKPAADPWSSLFDKDGNNALRHPINSMNLWLLYLAFVSFLLNSTTHLCYVSSEVRSALGHTGANLRFDTIFDGEVNQEFIKAISEAAKDRLQASTAPEPGEEKNSSEIKELMDQRDDEIIEVVEAVKQHQNGPSEEKGRIIDNDKHEDILSFSQSKAINAVLEKNFLATTVENKVRQHGTIGFAVGNDECNDPCPRDFPLYDISTHPQDLLSSNRGLEESHMFKLMQIGSDSFCISGNLACNGDCATPMKHGEYFKHLFDPFAHWSGFILDQASISAANNGGRPKLDPWNGTWNVNSLVSMGSEYFDEEYDNFIKGVSSQFSGVMEFEPIDDMGSDNFNRRALSRSWI
jgi:hypothetical protein